VDIVRLLTLVGSSSRLGLVVDLFAVYAFLALKLVLKDIGNSVASWARLSVCWQEAGNDPIGVEVLVDVCDWYAVWAWSDLDGLESLSLGALDLGLELKVVAGTFRVFIRIELYFVRG